jgi:hypothetical protein
LEEARDAHGGVKAKQEEAAAKLEQVPAKIERQVHRSNINMRLQQICL